MAFTPTHIQLHTRTRPGDVVYSVRNGNMPPPQSLIGGAGLPCFLDSMTAQQGLVAAGLPFPVGRYLTAPTTHIGLHDTPAFTETDGPRYRAAGFDLVELPDGSLRLLSREVLTALPPNPIGEELKRTVTAPVIKSQAHFGAEVVRRYHAKHRHGHVTGEFPSENAFHAWHADHHERFRDRLGHGKDDHGKGWLALRKAKFSAAERRKYAQTGVALPDGSFPIRDETDLEHAEEDLPRTDHPAAAAAHIRERARALGMHRVKRAVKQRA